jgi:hypothetical protein
MTASPATRRRASARLVAVAAARRLPSRISTIREDANHAVQVEELKAFVKAARKLVFALPFGKALGSPAQRPE